MNNKAYDNHERVIFYNSKVLKCIVAIHNTQLGPAVGGTRMTTYNSFDDALTDVLKLSRGMTYKSAMAGLSLGGGKAVIIGNPYKDKTEELLLEYGKFIESLDGLYMPAEDVGITVQDMEIVKRTTKYARGIINDPSPATAYGVYKGILAAVKYKLEKDSVKDLRIAIQGLGSVGKRLAKLLLKDGTIVYASDIRNEVFEDSNIIRVNNNEIHNLDMDVFAPCAMGGILRSNTIPYLGAKIIAGAANNQLTKDEHGEELRKRNILYAPDYVINAGGIIRVSHENTDNVKSELDKIGDRLTEIFTLTDYFKEKSTNRMADLLVEERLDDI